MKIKTVEFGRLKSYGTFNNVKVGITVDVEDGESPHMALARAQSWVQRELERIVGKDAMKTDVTLQQREINYDDVQF